MADNENRQGTNPLGENPFGENPFGEGFQRDNTFGSFGMAPKDGSEYGILSNGDVDEERVCPNCGAAMEARETYCMHCGMTVTPVFKRDYAKAMEGAGNRAANGDSNGGGAEGSFGAGAYGGNAGGTYGGTGGYGGNTGGTYGSTGGYGGNTGGTYGSTGGYGGNSYGGSTYRSSGATPRGTRKQDNGLFKIVLLLIIIASGIAAVVFFVKGISASKEPTSTTLERTVISELEGKVIQKVTEGVKIDAVGDVVTGLVIYYSYEKEFLWDPSKTFMKVKNDVQQKFEQAAVGNYFISYKVEDRADTIYVEVVYTNLDIPDNVKFLQEHDIYKPKEMDQIVTKNGQMSKKILIDKIKISGYHEA